MSGNLRAEVRRVREEAGRAGGESSVSELLRKAMAGELPPRPPGWLPDAELCGLLAGTSEERLLEGLWLDWPQVQRVTGRVARVAALRAEFEAIRDADERVRWMAARLRAEYGGTSGG